MSEAISTALDVLKKSFIEDQNFADVWHDNIAMSFFDCFNDKQSLTQREIYDISNEGASRFMKLAFNVTTKVPKDRN